MTPLINSQLKSCSLWPCKKSYDWLYTSATTNKKSHGKMPQVIIGQSVADSVNLPASESNLTENLSMNKVSAQWVLRMLSDVQKAGELKH